MEDQKATDEETLVCTDSAPLREKIRAEGTDALICLSGEDEIDLFPTGKYFIIDAPKAEYEYYERVWKRIHNIPWEVIKTKRLILRETVEDDVDEFAKIYSDPEITEFTEDLYPDIEEEKKYVAEYRSKVYAVQGFGIWTLLEKKTGSVIGRAGLTFRKGFEDVEIGFVVGSKWQNRGYATEAVRAVTDFAFSLGFPGVVALVRPGNTKSERVLFKAGYTFLSNKTVENTEYKVYSVSSGNSGS